MNALFAQYERFAFGFDWAKAPLNTWHTPVIACTAYLLLVAALYPRAKAMAAEFKAAKERGEERPVTFMTHVFAYHNLGICLASLVMFVGGAFEVYRRITGAVEYSQHGAQYGKSDQLDFSFLFCESTATVSKGPIFLWSFIYGLSKLPELSDTIYALIRGTIPPSFGLHVFHHAIVLFMVFFWLETQQSLQFIGLLFNTFVHVIMYWYYFQRAYGVTPWWKNWITRLQILQFATSFASLCIMLYMRFGANPAAESCAGEGAVAFNGAFNAILLSGFLGVLGRNTKPKSKKQ